MNTKVFKGIGTAVSLLIPVGVQMKTTRLARLASMAVAAIEVAGVQVGVQALTAAPAAAAVNAQVYTAESLRNSEANKFAAARCPADKSLLGGGGRMFFGEGGVVLGTLYPFFDSSGDGYFAGAHERTGGYSGSWYVRAYAICGDKRSDLEIVSSFNNTPIGSRSKSTTARCPNGKYVVGTGGVAGGAPDVSFESVYPGYQLGQALRVNATEDATDDVPIPPNFGVTAYAICAYPPAGYELVSEVSAQGPADGHGVGARCPQGKTALSAGVGNSYAGDGARVDSLYPLTTANNSSGVTRAQRWTSSSQSWYLYADAICAY